MKISAVFTMRGRPYYFESLMRLQDADEIIPSVDDPMNKREHIVTWNDAFHHATGDVLLICGERQVFREDWREILEAKIHEIKSGVISFWPGELTVAGGAVTRDFYENELGGNMWSPDYLHYWGDVELGHKSSMLGKYFEIPDMIEIKQPKGDVVSEHVKEFDKETFYLRKELGFPNTRIRTDIWKQEHLN